MIQRPVHYPIARLAVAGYVTLAMLAWIGFVPGSFPPILGGSGRVEVVPALVTATISLLVITILVPVLWRGPARSRWMAAMLAVFPVLMFAIILPRIIAELA